MQVLLDMLWDEDKQIFMPRDCLDWRTSKVCHLKLVADMVKGFVCDVGGPAFLKLSMPVDCLV